MIFVIFDPTLRYVFFSDICVRYKVYICNQHYISEILSINMIILQFFFVCVWLLTSY